MTLFNAVRGGRRKQGAASAARDLQLRKKLTRGRDLLPELLGDMTAAEKGGARTEAYLERLGTGGRFRLRSTGSTRTPCAVAAAGCGAFCDSTAYSVYCHRHPSWLRRRPS